MEISLKIQIIKFLLGLLSILIAILYQQGLQTKVISKFIFMVK